MQGKKEKFYAILKKYGVKCYWSTKYFDPEKDHPNGEIVIPKDDVDLFIEVDSLYNNEDLLSETDMLFITTKKVNNNNLGYFKQYVSDMVRHEVK